MQASNSLSSLRTLAGVYRVHSSVLLHNFRQVDRLCLCGMNLYRIYQSNKAVPVAYFSHAECSHVAPEMRRQVFLLFAVLLAELAMGAPLTIVHTNSPNKSLFEVSEAFLLPGYRDAMDWETLSEPLCERAYETPGLCNSHEYFEAMDYSYELSQMLCKRDFCADDLAICIEKIVTPYVPTILIIDYWILTCNIQSRKRT